MADHSDADWMIRLLRLLLEPARWKATVAREKRRQRRWFNPDSPDVLDRHERRVAQIFIDLPRRPRKYLWDDPPGWFDNHVRAWEDER